jgi:hypothetical protein
MFYSSIWFQSILIKQRSDLMSVSQSLLLMKTNSSSIILTFFASCKKTDVFFCNYFYTEIFHVDSRQNISLRKQKCLECYVAFSDYQYSFIHSAGPKPLPNKALHIVRSIASSFRWDYPLLSLRSSSSFLRLLPSFLLLHPSFYLSFNNLLQKAVSTQNVTNPVSLPFIISCRIFLCSLTVSNTFSFLTWSIQLIFSSIKFQNFPGISDLPPEVSKCQHHTKPRSKCNILYILSIYNPNTFIQGVPGRNVNILGDHSIGHSKQKGVYIHGVYSERFSR